MVQRPSLPMDGTWERVQLHLAYPLLSDMPNAIMCSCLDLIMQLSEKGLHYV